MKPGNRSSIEVVRAEASRLREQLANLLSNDDQKNAMSLVDEAPKIDNSSRFTHAAQILKFEADGLPINGECTEEIARGDLDLLILT
jgi:hypothetical protein